MNESKTRAPHEVQRSALDELRQEPGSRAQFLKMVGGAGAAGALSVLIAACGGDDEKDTSSSSGSSSSGSSGGGASKADLEIVNYALTLEYLETEFYARAAESGMLKGKALETAKAFGHNEQEHVDALTALIQKAGGDPAAKPKAKFPLKDEKSILELAATVETSAPTPTSARRTRSPTRRSSPPRCPSTPSRHATRPCSTR